MGLEPTTTGITIQGSTNLAIATIVVDSALAESLRTHGALDRIRT